MRNHIAATIATAAIALMALNGPSAAKPKAEGPEGMAVDWYVHDMKLGCVNKDGNEDYCVFTPDTHFKAYESSDHKAAIAFINYLTDPTGNDSAMSGLVMNWSPEKNRWLVVKRLYNIAGQEPSGVKFADGKVSFNLKTWRKSDPHCCPTGNKTIVEATR